MNHYGTDLARIHHEGHDELARTAGPGIVNHLRRAGIGSGLVVDLGCGSGLLAKHLVDNGYDVLGVDPSAAMLRLAKGVAPAARFICSRAEDLELPECVAVLSTGEALTYLRPSAAPSAHLRRHIRRAAAALVPGGLFMFDAIEQSGPPMNYRTWRTAGNWAVLVDVTEDRRRHLVRRRITTFARTGSTSYRRSDVEHRVGVYARQAVLDDLRRHGFIARTLPGYSAAPLAPRRVVFYARRVHPAAARRGR